MGRLLSLAPALPPTQRNVILIAASTGRADKVDRTEYVCGICGFALNELRQCPRCRMQVEQTAKGAEWEAPTTGVLREIDQIVEKQWEDSDKTGDRFRQLMRLFPVVFQ